MTTEEQSEAQEEASTSEILCEACRAPATSFEDWNLCESCAELSEESVLAKACETLHNERDAALVTIKQLEEKVERFQLGNTIESDFITKREDLLMAELEQEREKVALLMQPIPNTPGEFPWEMMRLWCANYAVEKQRWRDAEQKVDQLERDLSDSLDNASRLSGRCREGRQLLHRLVKYAREDRAATPGTTRLERLVGQVESYLQRTAEPTDILRATPSAEGTE